MLQLGTKYQINPLRQEAISRLVFYFPPRLEDFKNRHATDWEGRIPGCDDQVFCDGPIDYIDTCHAWAVIVLARALDIPALLPPAFYLAAQYEPSEVFTDFTDNDDMTWTLSAEDTRRAIVGQEQLRRRTTELRMYLTDKPSSECIDRKACTETQSAIARIVLEDAYHDTKALLHATSFEKARPLCDICMDHFLSHYEQARSKSWSELAEYFDLKDVEWPVANSAEEEVCLFADFLLS